ncbi:hypothetical protein BPMI_01516 [Candidatus Burkholderia pumila]|uniref:CHRD domain-containing protein n=1 Tax=Candidatus Burkholderia pumila TaxID=1090375 RepID=A0ABR5HL69_9BURK|nr:hypothetical protein BPMI_01516 [Candidatus Burkholderia pumila]
MKRCRPHIRWALAFTFALLASTAMTISAQADTVTLKANLQPSSEVPPRVSKGHGILDATFDTDIKLLTYTATYADLSGPVTMAHFHGPAPVGQNAKVQVSVEKNALASPMKGQATLTDQQVTDLMAGQGYFNIQTQENPTGEIRGQVMPSSMSWQSELACWMLQKSMRSETAKPEIDVQRTRAHTSRRVWLPRVPRGWRLEDVRDGSM